MKFYLLINIFYLEDSNLIFYLKRKNSTNQQLFEKKEESQVWIFPPNISNKTNTLIFIDNNKKLTPVMLGRWEVEGESVPLFFNPLILFHSNHVSL